MAANVDSTPTQIDRTTAVLADAVSPDQERDALAWWIKEARKRRDAREMERTKGEAA